MKINSKKYILSITVIGLFVLGLAARIYSLSNLGFEFDTITTQHTWAQQAVRMGFVDFWRNYPKFVDYLPAAVMFASVLKYIALIFNDSAATFVLILKIFNICTDLLLVWHIYTWAVMKAKLQANKVLIIIALFWALPGLWFVSSYWGQFDNLIVLLTFISFVNLSTAFKFPWQKLSIFKKINTSIWAGLLLAVAFSLKPLPLLFAPLYILFLFQNKAKIKAFILSAGLTFIIINIIPFLAYPQRTLVVFHSVFTRSGEISHGASSFWTLFPSLTSVNSVVLSLGALKITVAVLGIIIFTLICSALGLYLIKFNFKRNFAWPQLILLAAIENLTYYLFMMGMHSRYAQFAISFALIPLFYIKNKLFAAGYLSVYVIFNIAYGYNQLSVYYLDYKNKFPLNIDYVIYQPNYSHLVTFIYILMLIVLGISTVIIRNTAIKNANTIN